MTVSGVVARVDLRGVVVLDRDGRTWPAAVRKRLQDPGARLGNAVVVGDEVELGGGAAAVVTAVRPRRNEFTRGAAGDTGRMQVLAANLDQVLALASLRNPPLREGLLDRFAVAAEHARIPLAIGLAKADLADENDVLAARSIYERAGYPTFVLAAREGRGVDSIRSAIAGKRTLVVGHSGVGKSTLLNALEPGLGLRIGEVNVKTGKGRHTTTAALLVRLGSGAGIESGGSNAEIESGGPGVPLTEVIDTPGVRTFALPPIAVEELGGLFPDWRDAGPCRFANCAHRGEPGCAMASAVAAGAMGEERYRSYLKLRQELEGALAR